MSEPVSDIEIITLPPLRLFLVSRPAPLKEDYVEAHTVSLNEAVLVFQVYRFAQDGVSVLQYAHRMFRVWTDVEEIPVAPGSGLTN